MLINVKMPTIVGIIVGILTFMSRINSMLIWDEHGKSFITSGPVLFLYNRRLVNELNWWGKPSGIQDDLSHEIRLIINLNFQLLCWSYSEFTKFEHVLTRASVTHLWGPPLGGTCSLVPWNKLACSPAPQKSKICCCFLFPVPQYCLCSPVPLKIWPLFPCSPEINTLFPLFPKTPGRASFVEHMVYFTEFERALTLMFINIFIILYILLNLNVCLLVC